DNTNLYSLILLNTDKLVSNIDRYEILRQLQKNNQLLTKDKDLEIEIDVEVQNVLYEIQRLLKRVKRFEKGTMEWYRQGEEIEKELGSRKALEDYISEWMMKKFPFTPVITNEVFNKRKIPGVQKRAAISILEQLLAENFDGNFEIKGNG